MFFFNVKVLNYVNRLLFTGWIIYILIFSIDSANLLILFAILVGFFT